tara:strand:+ start:1133 stop:1234 length:102 start_codon:yes stop_codon:yes gene_type:complete
MTTLTLQVYSSDLFIPENLVKHYRVLGFGVVEI